MCDWSINRYSYNVYKYYGVYTYSLLYKLEISNAVHLWQKIVTMIYWIILIAKFSYTFCWRWIKKGELAICQWNIIYQWWNEHVSSTHLDLHYWCFTAVQSVLSMICQIFSLIWVSSSILGEICDKVTNTNMIKKTKRYAGHNGSAKRIQ